MFSFFNPFETAPRSKSFDPWTNRNIYFQDEEQDANDNEEDFFYNPQQRPRAHLKKQATAATRRRKSEPLTKEKPKAQQKQHAKPAPQPSPQQKPAQTKDSRDLAKIEEITKKVEDLLAQIISLASQCVSDKAATEEEQQVQQKKLDFEFKKYDELLTQQILALDSIEPEDEDIRQQRKALIVRAQRIIKMIETMKNNHLLKAKHEEQQSQQQHL